MRPEWGGVGAATTLSGVEARCHLCGAYSGLRVDADRFVCSDRAYCDRNATGRPADVLETMLAEFLAAVRES